MKKSHMHKILIIDDDTYICKLMKNFLVKHGYQGDTAITGSDAIKKINKGDYQLILSDYRLPDLDGFEILSAARNLEPAPPVIIMTAYEDLGVAVRLIKVCGVDQHR